MHSGDHIVIEERPDREMTHIGEMRIAANGISCWNPAFDITPAMLIKGVITEKGVFEPKQLSAKVKEILEGETNNINNNNSNNNNT